MSETNNEEQVDAAQLEEAKSLGWADQSKWRGNPDDWVDAKEFLRRGHNVLPIVRATNAKMMAELATARAQIASLKATTDQQSATVKELITHQAAEIKRQVESRIADLRKEKTAALRAGDNDLAAELEEKIDTTKDQLAEANKAPPPPPPPKPQQFQGVDIPADVQPWAVEFEADNKDWLGRDKKRTSLFMGICEENYATTALRGKDLLEKSKEQMLEIMEPKARRESKSEGGSGGWGGSGGGDSGAAEGFASLPKEAKDACKAQASKFVGAKGSGKAFETMAAWQEHFAKTFNATRR